jgi:hypothetical protein
MSPASPRRRRPAQALLFAAVLVGLTGCHARYKKMSRQIGSVQPMVGNPGEPVVDAGGLGDSDVTGTALEEAVDVVVGVGVAVKAAKVQTRLQRAVEPEEVAAALESSIAQAPAKRGLPHKISPEGKHLMRVEIVDYGVGISPSGPVVQTTISVRIDRKRDGKRVYRATTSCEEPLATMPNVHIPGVEQIRTLQALSQVEELTRKELGEATLLGVQRCGEQVVDKMVRHAN